MTIFLRIISPLSCYSGVGLSSLASHWAKTDAYLLDCSLSILHIDLPTILSIGLCGFSHFVLIAFGRILVMDSVTTSN